MFKTVFPGVGGIYNISRSDKTQLSVKIKACIYFFDGDYN